MFKEQQMRMTWSLRKDSIEISRRQELDWEDYITATNTQSGS